MPTASLNRARWFSQAMSAISSTICGSSKYLQSSPNTRSGTAVVERLGSDGQSQGRNATMRKDSVKVRRAASKPSSRKPSSGGCSEQGIYVFAFGGNGVPVALRTAQAPSPPVGCADGERAGE
jgi:hypothetical protein